MILQNPFPATHVVSQLSALLPGCHLSLPSPPPFHHGARWRQSRNSRPSSGLRTLYLSCLSFAQALRLFSIVCRLFLQNTGGGGVPRSRDSARLSAFCPPRNLFARCSRTLYPQSRLHLRFP